jgi:hypothetical protein
VAIGFVATTARRGAGGAALIAAQPIGSVPTSKTTSFDFIVQCSCQTAYTRIQQAVLPETKQMCILLQKITEYLPSPTDAAQLLIRCWSSINQAPPRGNQNIPGVLTEGCF